MLKLATCLETNNESAMLCYWMYTIHGPQGSPCRASFGVQHKSFQKQAGTVVSQLQEEKFCCPRRGEVWSTTKHVQSDFFIPFSSRCYHKHIQIPDCSFMVVEHTLTFSRIKQMFQRKEVDLLRVLKNLKKTLKTGRF